MPNLDPVKLRCNNVVLRTAALPFSLPYTLLNYDNLVLGTNVRSIERHKIFLISPSCSKCA